MVWISLGAAVIAAFLLWNLFKRFGADRIEAFNAKRRASSRIVGRGELIDGNRHVDVALAVTASEFFYENADMEGAIDLERVREIEYDSELATGTAIAHGKVLRLRCQSQIFEFVIAHDAAARWEAALPPRRELPEASAPRGLTHQGTILSVPEASAV